jgi:TRAP-type C4-dicarboxylate transport system permease small subunit
MRKLLLLTSLCLVGVLVFASVAGAQTATGTAAAAQYAQYATATALPATGGPTSGSGLVGLMAAALLVGTGLLGLTLVRRSS